MVDSVNIQSGIDPTAAATAEAARVAAAAATFNAQNVDPAANTQQAGELIAGKFKSNEDLATGYKSLESQMGKLTAELAALKGTTTVAAKVETAAVVDPAVTDPAKLTIDATAAASSAGFKLADLSAEYATHGDLTPETRASLEKAGFGKDVVDSYIEGQKVLNEAANAQVMDKAGVTKESFAAMSKWAGASVSPEDLAAYNEAAAGSPAMKQFALEAMHTRFLRAQGSDPVLFRGERGVGNSSNVYRSTEQMVTDMKNPLYRTDPAFRADVEAKVARSKLS